jgi:hypothetical protein
MLAVREMHLVVSDPQTRRIPMPDRYLTQLADHARNDRRVAAPIAIVMTLALIGIIGALLRIALP